MEVEKIHLRVGYPKVVFDQDDHRNTRPNYAGKLFCRFPFASSAGGVSVHSEDQAHSSGSVLSNSKSITRAIRAVSLRKCCMPPASCKPALVLGLNANHNHVLKGLFKDAAVTARTRGGPFKDFYATRVAEGMEPELASLTLARKITTLALTLWKKGECFNAEHLKAQAA